MQIETDGWVNHGKGLQEACRRAARQAHRFMGHLYELEDLEQEAFLYAATHADRVRAWYKDGGERLAASRIRSAVFESNKAHVRNWEQADLGWEALTE